MSADAALTEKVRINGITKTFGHGAAAVTALDTLDLILYDRDFVCLVGPSGCGKSTLLNIIAGFIKPTTGSVTIDNREISGPGVDRGVVFQHGALFAWMTVEGNILFGPACRGVPKAKARDIAQRYMHLVGLQKFADRYPYELSGGMQQRVGIARALANEPDVLLMDEPFAALDAQTRELMQEELKRIWRQTGKTILLITHSVDEALFLGTGVVVMTARPGRIKDQFDADFGESHFDTVSTSDLFVKSKRRVLDSLKDESRRAMSEEDEG